MALVQAPNGDVYDLPEATASGLVNSHESEWKYVDDKSTSAAKKSSASKK